MVQLCLSPLLLSWHPPGSLPTTSCSGSTSHGLVSAGLLRTMEEYVNTKGSFSKPTRDTRKSPNQFQFSSTPGKEDA